MRGIVNFYGLTLTVKASVTRRLKKHIAPGHWYFDLDKARELFTTIAYNKAIEQGIYTDGQNIVINVESARGASQTI